MKMMRFGNIVCEATVDDAFYFMAKDVLCEYPRDTIAYAVEHFLAGSDRYCRVCTFESWHVRLAKGKARRPRRFCYMIPASTMELPGAWVRLKGEIDEKGVLVKAVELFHTLPEEAEETPQGKCFRNRRKEAERDFRMCA